MSTKAAALFCFIVATPCSAATAIGFAHSGRLLEAGCFTAVTVVSAIMVRVVARS